jgi:hypothetical protein
MRPRLGIALGGAALAGVAGASLASWQAGPPTAVRFIVPAGAFGGNVLGSPNPTAPSPGLGTGWLLLRTLPDGTTPAPAAPAAPVVMAAAPAPAVPAAPARSSAPVTAILASFPIHLPAALNGLPRLPVPVSLPQVVSLLPHPAGNPGSHTPAPGTHGGNGTGTGAGTGSGGHGHQHDGQGQGSSQPGEDFQSGQD